MSTVLRIGWNTLAYGSVVGMLAAATVVVASYFGIGVK